MKIGKGLIKLETRVVPKEGAVLCLTSGADRVKLKVSQADLQVFENALIEIPKQIFKEFDTKFYYRFPKGKKPRVDMPKEWYDEIKSKFLQEKM